MPQNGRRLLQEWRLQPNADATVAVVRLARKQWQAGTLIDRARPRRCSVLLIRSSSVELLLNGQQRQLRANDACMFLPGQPYTLTVQHATEVELVVCAGKQAAIFCHKHIGRNSHVEQLNPNNSWPVNWQRMTASAELPGVVASVLTDGWWPIMVTSCAQAWPSLSDNGLDSWALITQAMDEHYQTAVSVADIAELVGFNRTWVSKCLQRQSGDGAQSWLLRRRMLGMCQALAQGAPSVGFVAQRFGWPSAAAFHKSFQRVFGINSGTWLREIASCGSAL